MFCRFTFTLLVVLAMVGCGKSENEIQRERAQAGLNRVVEAFMTQDPALLRGMLSKGQVETAQRRAEGHGQTLDATLLLEYGHQKEGLIMNFGEEWLSKNSIEVSDVESIADGFFAVSTLRNGEPYGKEVYFALEDGEFKFAGIERPIAKNLYSVTGATFWWNAWKFGNQGNGTYLRASFHCDDTSRQPVLYVATLSAGQEVNPVNCFVFEYWYGAKKTHVATLVYWDPPGPATLIHLGNGECMYNAIGLDAFVTPSLTWQCTPP